MAAKRPRAKSPFRAAPVRPATDRQNDYLAAVAQLTRELERAPNGAEVARHLGVSRQSATQQLQALEAKGLLVDVPRVVSSGKWALVSKG